MVPRLKGAVLSQVNFADEKCASALDALARGENVTIIGIGNSGLATSAALGTEDFCVHTALLPRLVKGVFQGREDTVVRLSVLAFDKRGMLIRQKIGMEASGPRGIAVVREFCSFLPSSSSA